MEGDHQKQAHQAFSRVRRLTMEEQIDGDYFM